MQTRERYTLTQKARGGGDARHLSQRAQGPVCILSPGGRRSCMSVAIAAVAVAASCAAPPAAAFFVPAALFANRATAHSCWGFAGSLKRTRNGLLLRGGGTSIVQAGRLSSSAMALATDHPRQTAEPSAQVRWLTPPGVRVILGSSSFTRKLLLKEMGVDYEIQSPDIDEKAIRDEDPQVIACLPVHALPASSACLDGP